MSLEEIRSFLVRTQLGAPPADVAAVQSLGIDAWLDRALTFERDTAEELAAAGQIVDLRTPQMDELARWWLFLMMRSKSPLQEVLAFFWHDHFATSQSVLDQKTRRFFLDHVNLLRRDAAGNLKDLSYRLAVDPAMLIWLDGVDSTRIRPNENFPREFWEVFTLGRDNGYTQEDIREAARAFTGYRLVQDQPTGDAFVIFDESRHDDGQKTIFGRSGRFGYREVVELTFELRPVAEYVSRRLFQHFCHQDPSPGTIAVMADILRKSQWELRPLLKTILRSRAFFSTRARGSQVKGPVEYVVGLMRATGFEMPVRDVYDAMIRLNQLPTAPPSVFGWPENGAWLGSQSVLERGNVLNEVLTDRSHHQLMGVDLAQLLPPPGNRSAGEVVDALATRLDLKLTAEERQVYVDFLGSRTRLVNNQLEVTAAAFDAQDRRQLDERVRALLFMLTQHPSYHVR